ncbi:hypothetical protein J7337_011168 [Fusarium musae]|uniref:Uncharacterized protein n=1 Tax=Fusarium musae TaxID=1042133 RepID=A0A9P8DAA1_9HYPO|nr:hypothetical protein J7337_011168 [Fusarium musae]KAG9498272.1 hypothetical protein J7337_011168 [Fusarium musae]
MPLETFPDPPRASFLGLPLEMRQLIYLQYFTAEGGYIYDAESDKLVQANGFPIDLSLRHVCRTIALETYHYPFTLNNITFSTAYKREWRKQAAAVDFISTYHHYLQLAMLIRLRHCLTPDMYEQPIKQYSKYMPLVINDIADIIARERRYPKFNAELLETVHIREFMEHPGSGSKAGNPIAISIYDNNVSRNRTYTYLLRKIAHQYPEKFKEAVDNFLPGWMECKSRRASDFFGLGFDLWAIPCLSQVTDMVEQLQLTERWNRLDQWRYSDVGKEGYTGTRYCYQRKHFFSAAALAIRFLENISQTQRLLITKLILNEDRMAVGHPECHIIGLIPFFEENPNLFIEHKINLWRNILPRNAAKVDVSSFPTENESIEEVPEGMPSPHQVYSKFAGKEISHFILHTMEALREGIPATSYSFIIDGKPDLNHSTETFKYLMELPIAWITTHTDCVAEGLLASPASSEYPFMTTSSTSEHTSVQGRSSIIQCNFTLDQPWDYKHIAGDNNQNIDRWKTLDKIHQFANEGNGEFSDKLDVSKGAVDWMQIKGEYFEMRLLSDIPSEETKALGSGESLSE